MDGVGVGGFIDSNAGNRRASATEAAGATGAQDGLLAEVDGELVARVAVDNGRLRVGDHAAHERSLGVEGAGVLDRDLGGDAVVGQDG